jgi:hypothetical protein
MKGEYNMIDTPNCEDCIHDEVCKIKKEAYIYRECLLDAMNDNEIPKGILMNMNCTYFSKYEEE